MEMAAESAPPSQESAMKYLAMTAAALISVSALAHHGWSWAEEDQSELKGTIESISMSPPHPSMRVKAADGVWQVDLGNPNQTERSGFKGDSAKAGDPITVLGMIPPRPATPSPCSATARSTRPNCT
jgi:hypothetical protein